jgi:hypothetical protein
VVGTGFTVQNSGALQGYATSLSTLQGSNLNIQVSSTFSSYTSATVRLAPAAGDPIQMTPPAARTGKLQLLQANYHSAGCGWSPSFSVAVAADWPPGIYASQLTAPAGLQHHVMFVVRPTTPQRDIAVLVPTNTYNAYNYWGGHNQYTTGQFGSQRTVTMQRPNMGTYRADFYVTNTGIIDHLLYSDLLLSRWMTSAGITTDWYTDLDLDATGASWLRTPSQGGTYKAVVMTTHPEYFSQTARDNLVNYQNAGGRIVYLGGNGIYEKIQYTTDRTAMIFRTTDGSRALFQNIGEPETQILGVELYPASFMNFAAYQVLNDHPFLAGTGLTVGSTFGAVAYNGAASGWELDRQTDDLPGATLIAQGLNKTGGAQMFYVPKPNNGWVFTASSLSLTGALPKDAAVRQILLNVFTAAVA